MEKRTWADDEREREGWTTKRRRSTAGGDIEKDRAKDKGLNLKSIA